MGVWRLRGELKRRQKSMRSMLAMMAAFALTLVFIIVFFVFLTYMQGVMRQTELLHVDELSETLLTTLNRVEDNLQTNTLAMASWDDARNYVINQNSQYLKSNMTDYAMLKDYTYDYVVLKDLKGRDLYTMGYDFASGQGAVLPLGFTTRLTQVAEKALARYGQDERIRSHEHRYAGLLLYEGEPYLLCTLPISDNLRLAPPVGTFTFALRFTQDFVRAVTGLPMLKLDIRAASSDIGAEPYVVRSGADHLSVSKQMDDILGNPIVLTMTYPRTIFHEGQRMVVLTSLVLMGLLLGALSLMFFLINRLVITPTRVMAADVQAVSADAPLDMDKYGGTTELRVLGMSVNDMVARLEKTRQLQERDKMSIDTLQTILNSMDAYLYVTDPDTSEILFINDKMQRHFGLSKQAKGQVCWRVLQEDFSGECDFCPVKKLRQDPEAVVLWEEHNTVTGRYYRNTDKLIDWTHGRRVHLQHSVDITDIKEAEDKLIRLSGTIESAPQYISLINDRGECDYFNPAAERITGYTVDELMAGGFGLLYDESDMNAIYGEIVPQINAQGRYVFELFMRRKDGQYRLMQFFGFKLDGKNGGMGAIAVDITETRQLEKDLTEAKEIAEQTSQAKSEFLSRMSHEMRTPMNAIIGMTNIGKMSQSWERREYCLNKIEGASKHLLGVINDILDMSKIEANKFELSFIDFNFEKVLESVVNVIIFRTEEKHQVLALSVDDGIPPALFGDEQRLAQVLTNLLTNASKFTPEGGQITLHAGVKQQDEQRIVLHLDVSDTGIGISDEQQSRLFRSFEQADGGISRKFGGTGLGLAISKRIVELMGGQIWVRSAPGQGSTFSFTAVFGPSSAKLADSADQLNHSGLRILAVDDSDDALEYCRHVMSQLGEVCDVAASGDEALRLIEAAEPPYDLIFVDYQMPGMDGIELTREIRRMQALHPVIIMVSVTEWSEISEGALTAGVSSFIPKPLFPSQVAQCINNMFAVGMSQGEQRGLDEDPKRFAGLSVLLVEDVEINREIVTSMLSYTEIAFDEAENGEQAVWKFERDPEKYDMILMDIQMPVMDGLEATRRIRALPMPWAKRVPIVAMTANAFREDVERCLDAGMDAHVAKPLDMPQLMAELNKRLVKVTNKAESVQ